MPVGTKLPSQLQQSRMGIKYNPAVQSQLDRTTSSMQQYSQDSSRYGSFQERLDSNKQFGQQAHDTFMKNMQKQKELAEAAKRQQELQNQQAQLQNGYQQQQGSSPRISMQQQQQAGANLGGTALRKQIINNAKRYLGTPYVLGGGHQPNAVSPSKGFNGRVGLDCSGLTGIAFRQVGINLPGLADQQTRYGVRSHISNARPGDLVGWNKGGHVGIYIGNGQIIHAPSPGKSVEIRNIFRGEAIYAVRLSLPGD